ncbi:hypothetical protein [Vibrio splendidus]|uniref:hypothetical protein n=1 Tax=Vibrio splendidus TaxID=29497 RepID=UPI000066F2ED|nr:hypothetical protein [Vibrio splendidus]EAP95078.1 hypothetical protein V12B01_23205 [Vibrio splendidus 12B01]
MVERHLILIWSEAKDQRDRIIEDVKKHLELIHAETVRWTPELFAENLSRLYGQSLPNNSFKQKHCGTGHITILIVDDHAPKYEVHDIGSSRGFVSLNSNIYNLKIKYREWTGGGHKVHATNDLLESEHDILLLCHKKPNEFVRSTYDLDSIVDRDLLGAGGFENLYIFQDVIKTCNDYVFLRGEVSEELFLGKEDLDILVAEKLDFIFNLNLLHQGKKFSSTRYQAKIGDEYIHIDVNSIGDNTYDREWQKKMLKTRRLSNDGLYYLDEKNRKYSEIYHNIIHKDIYDSSSQIFLDSLKSDHGYDITEPNDLMISYFGEKYGGNEPSLKRKVFPLYRDFRYAIHKVKKAILS